MGRTMAARTTSMVWAGLAALLVLGCGSAPPPEATSPDGAGDDGGRRPGGPSVSAEIGALDEGKTEETFKRAMPKLDACFQKGAQRLPYLAGTVSFYVRVAGDGSARYVVLKDSTLGDRATEECMVGVLRSASWPRPEGGDEGEARNEFTFDPGDGERPPVQWSPEQLGPNWDKARPALSRCRKDAGTGPLKATLYVDTDGKPAAIGVSTEDEKGEAAVACVVDTLKGTTFASPGSWASKVSVVID